MKTSNLCNSSTTRRVDQLRMQSRQAPPIGRSRRPKLQPIELRILEGLRRMKEAGLEPHRIYLTAADIAELDRAQGRTVTSCGGFQVRRSAGRQSKIYSIHGVGRAVPKSLSTKSTSVKGKKS
ncbi:MAG TPA: hypothetical protein VGD10_08280 [Allosphingosinicella sp.]|uniref:hypothetical protein n=1 Tax=Allosphingosinicella sp. TaxID=2823234 RepID=UPI002ED878F5